MHIQDNTDDLLSEIDKEIAERLTKAILVVERKAKQLCKRKTGTLARSITSETEGNKAVCGTNVDYGPHVELGTKPHIITPKTKKALFWPGASHPVKVVHHPGTRAQPFLRPALLGSIGKIKKIFGAK